MAETSDNLRIPECLEMTEIDRQIVPPEPENSSPNLASDHSLSVSSSMTPANHPGGDGHDTSAYSEAESEPRTESEHSDERLLGIQRNESSYQPLIFEDTDSDQPGPNSPPPGYDARGYVIRTDLSPLEVASKKTVYNTMFYNQMGLLVIFITILTTVFGVGNRLDAKLESSMNVQLSILNNVCSRQTTANLTVTLAGKCYCLYKKNVPWEYARKFCDEHGPGVHLAEIYQKSVNDLLMPLLQASKPSNGVWLGGKRLAKNILWLWSHTGIYVEEFEPTQWSQQNVNLEGDTPQCLEATNTSDSAYFWKNTQCDELRTFLCSSAYSNSSCTC